MLTLPSLRLALEAPYGPWVWTLTPLLLAGLPHFIRYPAWISVVCIGLWLLRLQALRRPRLIPSRIFRLLLTVGSIAGVYASYGFLLGPTPGTALLLLLLGLKPLESKTRRDHVLLLFMAYLLVLLQFLQSQSLPGAVYMMAVVVVITAALLGQFHPPSQGAPLVRLRRAGLLLAQALPVMIVLFLLFPRLPGSLWGMMHQPQRGLTGISDTMRPGDISELLQSSEAVFRVEFEGDAPPERDMYWRTLVLWEMDGRTWRMGTPDAPPLPWPVSGLHPPIVYVLTLEAHEQRWLPALEMPAEVPPRLEHTSDLRLVLPEKLRQRQRYELRSVLEYSPLPLNRDDRRRALALPNQGNEQARGLATRWANQAGSDQGVVDLALELFRQDGFGYTLRPPLLGDNAVDDFLFRTRSGYCEHYASAFTFLMRASGIPARVVVGYQGAEYNPLGEYYVVRQYHAHAWSEVFLKGQGWVRVDPTNVLAPERIDQGTEALVPNIDVPAFFSSREVGWLIQAWRGMTQGWDAVNMAWNQWVLGFGFERQKQFLRRLGLDAASRLQGFGYVITGLSLCLLAAGLVHVFVAHRARQPADRLDRAYLRFCRRLARIGLARAPHEGPLDFAQRVAGQRPDLSRTVLAISQSYARQRYGPWRQPEQDRRLIRALRQFRPKSSPSKG